MKLLIPEVAYHIGTDKPRSNAEAIYEKITSGEPQAVAYYQNLKARIADGQRAQLVYDAIRAVHEQRKAMNTKTRNPFIGSTVPPGSFRTPNGQILTPGVIAQLVRTIRDAALSVPQFASPMPGGGVSNFGPTTVSLQQPPSLRDQAFSTVQKMQQTQSPYTETRALRSQLLTTLR